MNKISFLYALCITLLCVSNAVHAFHDSAHEFWKDVHQGRMTQELMAEYVESGFDLNKQTQRVDGQMLVYAPLHRCLDDYRRFGNLIEMGNRYKNCFKLLLGNGADKENCVNNIRFDTYGKCYEETRHNTVLVHAIGFGLEWALNLLFKHNVSLSNKEGGYETPLKRAVSEWTRSHNTPFVSSWAEDLFKKREFILTKVLKATPPLDILALAEADYEQFDVDLYWYDLQKYKENPFYKHSVVLNICRQKLRPLYLFALPAQLSKNNAHIFNQLPHKRAI